MDEIVRFIACELITSRAKATAAALAGCRKGFEDPVLDALWETQEELLPLLKTFPGDVWKDGGCAVSAPTVHVFPSLNRLVLKSFKDYRRRRNGPAFRSTLEGCESSELAISKNPSLRRCSRFYSSTPSANPYVQRPTSDSSQRFVPFIPLFLSPRTTDIIIWDFRSNLPKAMVASMITVFPALCPNWGGYHPRPIKRSNDHCCCLQNAPRDQSKYPPAFPRGFPVDRGGQSNDLQSPQPA